MIRIGLLTVCVLAGMLTMGCIDYEEVLTLRDDGSGTIQIHFVMDTKLIEEMEAWSAKMGGPGGEETAPDEPCSEAEMREALAAMGSRLKLLSYRSSESDNLLTYDLEFEFSSAADLLDLDRACPDDEQDEESDGEGWTFSYRKEADGRWLYTRQFQGQDRASSSGSEPGDADMDFEALAGQMEGDGEDETPVDMEAMADMMKKIGEAMKDLPQNPGEGSTGDAVDLESMMSELGEGMQRMEEEAANHHVRFEVRLPASIVESNATETSDRVAVWEYTLDQIQNAPREMEAKTAP